MRSSIEEEYYEILKYLYYKYRERYNKSIRCIPQSILNMAIIHGNLDIIIWITDRCASYCYKETFKAAKYEHMDVLQWLYDVRIPEAFNLSLTINSNFFNNNEMVFYKNVSDLSEKILKISRDEKLRRKIGKAGKDKYLKYFNSTNIANYILQKTLDIKSGKKYFWEK